MTRRLSSVSWLLVGLLGAACTPPTAKQDQSGDPANTGLPPARVNLPPPIKLQGSIPPETHPDGKMRVDGLLARREKYLGQKVLVRGYLVEKYTCPKGAKRCEHPHGYLADTPAGGDKRLLLANLSQEILDLLETGTEYVVTGQYSTRSEDGFVASAGLLIYENIEGLVIPVKKPNKRSRRR